MFEQDQRDLMQPKRTQMLSASLCSTTPEPAFCVVRRILLLCSWSARMGCCAVGVNLAGQNESPPPEISPGWRVQRGKANPCWPSVLCLQVGEQIHRRLFLAFPPQRLRHRACIAPKAIRRGFPMFCNFRALLGVLDLQQVKEELTYRSFMHLLAVPFNPLGFVILIGGIGRVRDGMHALADRLFRCILRFHFLFFLAVGFMPPASERKLSSLSFSCNIFRTGANANSRTSASPVSPRCLKRIQPILV